MTPFSKKKDKDEQQNENIQNDENNNQNEKAMENKQNSKKCYNLIILDESGSMRCVWDATVSGCNEVLATIRTAAKENAELQQFVSIFCFDSDMKHSRYLMENTPIESVNDITMNDYIPTGCTPLNDAVGTTCTRLHNLVKDDVEATMMVTIITDGFENSSCEYSHLQVKKIIEDLKREGWIFSFIGANIDAEATASSYNISSSYQFAQNDADMKRMWDAERSARRRVWEKVRKMESCRFVSEAAYKTAKSQLNYGVFDEFSRTTPQLVNVLKPNEIFVFGSNLAGEHAGGAAAIAMAQFGAVWGQGVGLQGQSYAIPTMQGGVETIKPYVDKFIQFADNHPELNFLVTRIGCGIAGFTDKEIAPLFKRAVKLNNVALPESFWDVIR